MLWAVRMRSVAHLSAPTATRFPKLRITYVSADALRLIICHNH